MAETNKNMRLRKGKMYKSAEEGDSEELPKRKSDIVPLTKREKKKRNIFGDD